MVVNAHANKMFMEEDAIRAGQRHGVLVYKDANVTQITHTKKFVFILSNLFL